MSELVELVAQTAVLKNSNPGAAITDFDVIGSQQFDTDMPFGILTNQGMACPPDRKVLAELVDQLFKTAADVYTAQFGSGCQYAQVIENLFEGADFGTTATGLAQSNLVTADLEPAAHQWAIVPWYYPAVAVTWGPASFTGLKSSCLTWGWQFMESPTVGVLWGKVNFGSIFSQSVTLSQKLCEAEPIVLADTIDCIASFCENALARKSGQIRSIVVDGLRRRLLELLTPEEWDQTDRLPSRESFERFLCFLAKYSELRTPAVTITNEGNFVATWLRSKHDLVRLEFNDVGWVKSLVMLAPVETIGQSAQGTAKVPVDKVENFLSTFEVWEWMCSPRSP